MARDIIIDTDPGQDDCLAILLALASPELNLLGLTAVAGNVGVDLTAANALKICALAGRADIPVFAGCDRPLLRAPRHAAHVHGASGLDGAALPAPLRPLGGFHAVDWLIATLMSRPDRATTLLAIGPLTNIALALRREPRIATKIERLAIMGGAFACGGNMNAVAEFNIFVDPEAAEIVFAAGVPILLAPLDLTYQVRAGEAEIARIEALGRPSSAAIAKLLRFYAAHESVDPARPGVPLHDVCAVASLIDPSLFRGRDAFVAIETQGQITLGQTVADWRGVTKQPVNAHILLQPDCPRFFDLLVERLGRL